MFNYRKENKKFEEEWAKLEAWYQSNGMSDEAIQEMKKFDRQWFCSMRTYENKQQDLFSKVISNGEKSMLLNKTKGLYYTLEEDSTIGSWIDHIESEKLLLGLKELSLDEIELLTMLVIDEFKQCEIATIKGCSEIVISYKVLKIKNLLKNSLEKGVFAAK